MSDAKKTKKQLIQELEEARARIARLERSESKLKRTKETLLEECRLLHALMDNLPDCVYFKDTESRFIKISKSLADRFGLSDPAQAVGKTAFDFFAEEYARSVHKDERRVIESGKPLVNVEEKETWPDGRETWGSATRMPLRDKKGNIVGTFGISRDITKLRQSAERQTQLQQKLSTPIIPVVDLPGEGSVIVIPLIGNIDTLRAKEIMRSMLAGIREHRAKVVILDITGVPIVDSDVANHLTKAIQAARLKGARTIVTGISDAVAETIVDLGIDWSTVETLSHLQTGLVAALSSLGFELTKSK